MEVQPSVIEWALVRSGARSALEERFPRLVDWLRGDANPSLRQLEDFAKASRVPIGYLLLPEPPEEQLPVKDLRTFAGKGVRRASPDLLDVIYLCQRRQAWYQEYAESVGEEPRKFVGSVNLRSSPDAVAEGIAEKLGFSVSARRDCSTWSEALRLFIEQAEAVGVLVMVSGVVGSNNRRTLDPQEFRGFALADTLAPLVFINGADTKAAQMFTLAHELAHIWLGESAVTNAGMAAAPGQDVEVWCNRVAAEVLVPLAELRKQLPRGDALESVNAMSRAFKVSTLVILRRLLDAGRISRQRFQQAYDAEIERLASLPRSSGGGDFYLAQVRRLSRRFARAVITSTAEGQTLYRDAFQMLGVKKEQTFRELGRMLEVLP
ncbi:MAG: ImmA/IrrE family metallo-endopeptidase [Phycisphaeraceae bacterium]|nr:ImmA/IrrE family metallo-endopeptidase [Phycisphaeraceae bacterium]